MGGGVMGPGDIPGWLSVIIGIVGLYFLVQTYRKEVRPQNAVATEPSAMPREPWLTPRRQFALWLILVLLAWASAGSTFWLNRSASGPKLIGGIVYALLVGVNIEGKMTVTLYIFGGVGNLGTAPSGAFNYKVSVKKNGNTYVGTTLVLAKTNSVFPLDPDKQGNQGISFHDDEGLYNKTVTAIQPGNIVYGVLMVIFPNVSDYTALGGNLEIIMTFNDIYSNTYTVDQISKIVSDQKVPLMGLPGAHLEFPPMSAPPPVAPVPVPAPRSR